MCRLWEILLNSSAVANLIREGKTNQLKSIIQTSSDVGMLTLDQDLENKVAAGLIDKEIANLYMADGKIQ